VTPESPVTARSTVTTRIHPSADVDPRARVGDGSSVWHLAQVREGAELGEGCVVGRGAYVGAGVRLGRNCKLQNYALVYEPAVLEDGVFIGPAVVLTNDQYPRAVQPDGSLKSADDWEHVGVTVRTGASIGARAVCVAPVTVGRWALVAAGSVVVRDVPDFALVAGVPARFVRWVGRAGVPLEPSGQDEFRCPTTGELYVEKDGVLHESAASAGPPPPEEEHA
jgi:UDP-2-acetamido-3-amino-2,3-dideoxy-glucuronate N-acetyltransferase